MPINRPSFSTIDTEDSVSSIRLKMLPGRPDMTPENLLDPPWPPGHIYAWYNGSTDMVELYMTNFNGTGFLRVSSYPT